MQDSIHHLVFLTNIYFVGLKKDNGLLIFSDTFEEIQYVCFYSLLGLMTELACVVHSNNH